MSWQRKQRTSRTVRQKRDSLATTARGCESGIREVVIAACIPAPRQTIHSSACLGDDQALRGTSRYQKRITAHAATQFRDSPVATRRRLTFRSSNVRTQRHLDYSDLHAHHRSSPALRLRSTPPASTFSTPSNQGLNEGLNEMVLRMHGLGHSCVAVIAYQALTNAPQII